MRPNKHETWLNVAKVLAKRGTCMRRQVGCALVDFEGFILSTGYNGTPSGREHCSEGSLCSGWDAPSGQSLEFCQAIHAEANAIIRLPDPRKVYTCYTTSSPCIHCVKLLLGTNCYNIVFAEIYPHHDAQKWWTQAGREWIHLK